MILSNRIGKQELFFLIKKSSNTIKTESVFMCKFWLWKVRVDLCQQALHSLANLFWKCHMVLLFTLKTNCLVEDSICHNIYRQYLCLLKNNPCLLVVYDLQTLRQAVAKIFFLAWKRCFCSTASHSNNPDTLDLEKAAKKINNQMDSFKVKASEKTVHSDAQGGFVLRV